MINITHKSNTLRKAIAQAIVKVSSQETIQAVIEKKVPKGDVFEMAKVAGLFAAKRTADMIPDCHPLPVEFTAVSYEIKDLQIFIFVEIHTIYKTGVEVEAMHAASVVALTMYDMLKPLDKGISIEQIKLIEKKGGKTDFSKENIQVLKAAVIVCSDSIAAGKKEDSAGKAIIRKLENSKVQIHDYLVIPDEVNEIRNRLNQYVEQKVNMVIFTGGTGLSPRDVTPEAIKPLLKTEVPGIEEAIRAYGQQRTPYSMLSRSVAGLIGKTLVLALPGSTKGAEESMDAIFPAILHIFRVMEGPAFRHE
ncbi:MULTISPECIES: bifunctional molybdenum cofactor biosynthesis protein MoaC/MoaB [Cecembia]|uniref:Molybdopterin adenylyltransferase n=2 Tax=Cecembia TaxID=1187078 RepID=A0A4Q7PCY5_9BACT|nr:MULTISPECIES: bifunctional molybdenum cofactor biosynthesis protein MoaC/MoaB [Cecembia]PSL07796.1 cyclic pyranopterin monophosphate synthase subunit MoaC [Cecembia rubra]RZS97927.1 cyclic pyranopterin monophosphate synthase subunit MoaC [Cecembia calidifontis]